MIACATSHFNLYGRSVGRLTAKTGRRLATYLCATTCRASAKIAAQERYATLDEANSHAATRLEIGRCNDIAFLRAQSSTRTDGENEPPRTARRKSIQSKMATQQLTTRNQMKARERARTQTQRYLPTLTGRENWVRHCSRHEHGRPIGVEEKEHRIHQNIGAIQRSARTLTDPPSEMHIGPMTESQSERQQGMERLRE